jgi:Bacterial aa3 type cytochrome c oxidase subunit IV
MADELTPTGGDDPDYAAHLATYEAFIRGVVMACLAAGFGLVALVMFGFGKGAAVFLGFLGMVAGMVAIGIDMMSARGGWLFSIATLVLFALVTAINIS